LNAKTLGIGGILLTALSIWASRITGLITDEQLLNAFHFIVNLLVLGSIVLFFAAISYGISWTITEAYKRLYLHQKDWGKENVKRKIYRCAIWSAGFTMLACGSLFLLAEEVPVKWQIVVGVFWTLACVLVGFSSPIVWKWTFETLLPRFNRFVSGNKTMDNENEALDRPNETPRGD
jgi:hypothetical protein